ncbi:glucan biosynthesis protein C [Natronocella acetinitrilica]|uniref:Glucan biosynthesis protein C n=1 Tax=Natronocella acetinitrilica TaxID=414046 RepID=A0AAE3G9S6_9GAMM|nr:acyltransferase family protein [Natronocella acetinitrilica]MCP1677143.1 glucan biosynthesis protein C [Natronocella acetinitrilica]
MAAGAENGHISQRVTQLDALRACLMLLGIIIHASFVFISEQRWLVASDDVSYFFDYLTLSIHSFRMPAFFLISGFLYALVLCRSRILPFFASRSTRVLIPLFAAGVLLNGAQLYLFQIIGTEAGLATINGQACESVADVLRGACWEIHLWFLIVLFYFFILCFPIAIILTRVTKITIPTPSSWLWPATVVFFIAIVQAVYSAAYRGYFGFVDYLPFLSDPKFYYYLPYFVFGVLLSRAKIQPHAWTGLGLPAIALLLASWIYFLYSFSPADTSISQHVRGGRHQLWTSTAVAFQTTSALIVLFLRLPAFKPEISRYLSDCSYTIYLFHHILVFLLAVLLINTGLPIAIQFIALVIAVVLLSWAIHHYVVSRSRLGTIIFNGRLDNTARPRRSA